MTESAGVLYLANSAKIGGGNRALMALIARLDRSRFRPALVAPADGPLTEWAAAKDIPCDVVPGFDCTGRATLLRRAASIARIAASRRIRVIHSNGPLSYPAAALAGRFLGVPRICHLQFPTDAAELRASFISGPEAVVTCYSGLADEIRPTMRSLRPRCRIVAIPNPVEPEDFAGPIDRRARDRWRFGAEHVVLVVGHLSEVKGYPWFVEAAALINRQLQGCAFVALGGETTTPGYRQQLAALTAALGIADRFHFLGWRDEVADVLAAADVVVLPSLAEGLPLAILEAMASARPVVATAVNGVPEAVIEGENGLLVPPRDPEALATAALRLLRNPEEARHMGRDGRDRAMRLFSTSRFVRATEELYTDLLAARYRGRVPVSTPASASSDALAPREGHSVS